MSFKIDVVLCSYRRPYLVDQLKAIRTQTLKDHLGKITVWRNDNQDDLLFHRMNVHWIKAKENMGVWPRFIHACASSADYVAIFDDDAIPGPRWFENCVACIKHQDGLYGTHGAIFSNPADYYSFKGGIHGWKNPSPAPVEVDVIGHAWFFRPENARSYLEVPQLYPICGEDMNLSFAIQKAGLKSWIAPHPKNREYWGAAISHNNDKKGINVMKGTRPKFQEELARIRSLGWRLIND